MKMGCALSGRSWASARASKSAAGSSAAPLSHIWSAWFNRSLRGQRSPLKALERPWIPSPNDILRSNGRFDRYCRPFWSPISRLNGLNAAIVSGTSPLASQSVTKAPRDAFWGSGPSGSRTLVTMPKRPLRLTPIHVPWDEMSRPAMMAGASSHAAKGAASRA